MCASAVEASMRSRDTKAARFRSGLDDAKKEEDEANIENEGSNRRHFDYVYSTPEANFNHCLQMVMHLCEVLDHEVFDINKDIYEGELALIDDILEDEGVPCDTLYPHKYK